VHKSRAPIIEERWSEHLAKHLELVRDGVHHVGRGEVGNPHAVSRRVRSILQLDREF
jgi:hypothetical protein